MTIITKRTALLGMITTTAFAMAPVSGIAASQLNWSALRGDQNDFFRAPVLVSGQTESILIDGSFNYGGGAAVVEAIKASGTTLTTIFVSINDPDYYFSLKPIVEAYPQVRVIAAPDTISKLKAKVQSKLETWGPVLGEYGPQTLDDIIIPEPFEGDTLSLEGEKIEIVASDTMADRRYLYVPSLDAVFGGVYAFDGLHV